MSYSYSKKSRDELKTCHPDLQKIFNEAIKHMDITILEGRRSKKRQEELVRTGKSKTMNSKHLDQGDGFSHAIDASFYPIDWSDRERFTFYQGFIKGIAAVLHSRGEITHKTRHGVDWDNDGNIKEHSFFDGPHVELIKD